MTNTKRVFKDGKHIGTFRIVNIFKDHKNEIVKIDIEATNIENGQVRNIRIKDNDALEKLINDLKVQGIELLDEMEKVELFDRNNQSLGFFYKDENNCLWNDENGKFSEVEENKTPESANTLYVWFGTYKIKGVE